MKNMSDIIMKEIDIKTEALFATVEKEIMIAIREEKFETRRIFVRTEGIDGIAYDNFKKKFEDYDDYELLEEAEIRNSNLGNARQRHIIVRITNGLYRDICIDRVRSMKDLINYQI